MTFPRPGSRSLSLGVSSHVQPREARLSPLLAPGYGSRAWWKRRHLLRFRSRAARRCSVELTTCLGRPRSIPSEPVTITNLNAFVGLAYVSGMVTQTNTKTGEVVRLPFVNSDMRFMQGVFRGTDGKIHPGAFAFV